MLINKLTEYNWKKNTPISKTGTAKLLTLVLLEGLGELVDGGGDLQSLHQNSLLSLNSDVSWPLDETSKVALGLDVSTESEVASVLLEQRSGTGCTSGTSL